MSELVATRFVIAVKNLKEAAKFYEEKLGFEISELGDPGWLVFSKGTCSIMAGECPDDMPASDLGSHSYYAYLTLNEIDAYYDEVKNADAKIIKPLRDEPWGMREFGVRTNDGHRIMFGMNLD